MQFHGCGATLMWASLQAALFAGGDGAALFDLSAWAAALEGRLAVGFCLRLAGGAALLVAAAVPSRGLANRVGGVGAIAVVASYGLAGHTTASVAAIAAVVHVAALSIWIGGLLGLLRNVRHDRPERTELIRRFSRLAGWTLLATVVAGAGLAVSRLDDVRSLWETTYGRILIAKIVVVVANA